MKKSFFVKAAVLIFICFAIYLIITSIIFKGDWVTRGQFGDTFGFLNTLFSALAFVGVIYTLNIQRKESELQRMLSQLQLRDSELLIKPLLAIEPTSDIGKFKIRVTNIGNGTALNIDFEPLHLNPDLPLVYKAERIIYLKAGDSKELEIISYLGDEVSDFTWTAHLQKEYANRVMTISIHYCDIEFKEMKQSFDLGLGDLKVTMTKYK
ncbi:hypothetical protein HQN89_11000 [Paenibacillus frigoriresistens]|uniref:hypothetical protein n=1 Tax=Paenibacillus alginolyticus TaxID=59839 RepID=UPI0015654AEA|nr:hypothetical protein [Paenibacillus frigoriresistens]NRF91547.1 hypothetical protein [Paenibacillus frigoriresistens]